MNVVIEGGTGNGGGICSTAGTSKIHEEHLAFESHAVTRNNLLRLVRNVNPDDKVVMAFGEISRESFLFDGEHRNNQVESVFKGDVSTGTSGK